MRTAEDYVKEFFKDWVIAGQIKSHCKLLVNAARKETIEEVHEIIATMDWDVMFNTIDAKELQLKLNSLINELK
jgi:hypothetical protein